jgi:hypothetical protein
LLTVVAICSLTTNHAWAAGKQGEFLQTNSVGTSVVTRDFTTHHTTTIADYKNLSEFVGLHLYVLDRWRMGMNLQFTEQLAPAPPAGSSRFRTFAVLPQLGCNFYDPFYASLIYKIAPRTNGRSELDMAVQALLGVGVPVSSRVRATFALEAPFAFYIHRTLGLVVLAGMSIRL